jgi:hypothetical protein
MSIVGVLAKSFEYKAERMSAFYWFLGTLKDVELNFEEMCALEAEFKSSSRGQDKLRMSQISVLKLIMDGVFFVVK